MNAIVMHHLLLNVPVEMQLLAVPKLISLCIVPLLNTLLHHALFKLYSTCCVHMDVIAYLISWLISQICDRVF